MAEQIVLLEYNFLFDSVSTWQHLSQFESDLADFFAAHDLEAQLIQGITGQSGKRIMIIKKISKPEGMVEQEPNPQGRPLSLKTKIKQMTNRRLRKPAMEFMKGQHGVSGS